MRETLILVLSICVIVSSYGQNLERQISSNLLLTKQSNKSTSLYPGKPIHQISAVDNSKSILFTPKVNLGKKSDMAFFCRIEDKIARQSKVNFKFRLGSVSYVDALEGKGYFEALSYSRATNFRMSRQ